MNSPIATAARKSPSGSSRIQASNALNRASVSRGQPRGAGPGAATGASEGRRRPACRQGLLARDLGSLGARLVERLRARAEEERDEPGQDRAARHGAGLPPRRLGLARGARRR